MKLVAGLGISLLGSYLLLAQQTGNPRLPPGITVPPEPPFEDLSRAFAGPTFEEQVVELVNQERATYGGTLRPPLKHEALLDSSSELHSGNMAVRNFFDHCDLDFKWSPFDRMETAGYTLRLFAGENIAAGQATPSSVMSTWMTSPGHRNNILNTNYYEIGVGYYFEAADANNTRFDDLGNDCVADVFNGFGFRHYWTQNFGRRANVYPVVINREAYETSNQTVYLYVYGTGFAVEMRFRNDGGAWSLWEPYNEDKVWTLNATGGLREVFAEIKNGSGTVRSASDTILFTAPGPPADFFTVEPCRLIDTRNPAGPLGGPALVANADRTFTVIGTCNIPSTALAVSFNIAVTGASTAGNLRLHPGGTSVPLVSAINYGAGVTKSNNGVVPLNGAGQLAIFAGQAYGSVHVILDVNGYFE